jgi:hypothetical protein
VGTLAEDGSKNPNSSVPEKFFLPLTPNEMQTLEQKVRGTDIEDAELLGDTTSNISQNLMFCFQC